MDSREKLRRIVEEESAAFERTYHWLQTHMPERFLEVIDEKTRALLARQILSLPMQDNHSVMWLKDRAIVVCLDAPDADLKVLKNFSMYGIRSYRTYLSHEPFPTQELKSAPLRVTLLQFIEATHDASDVLPEEKRAMVEKIARAHVPKITDPELKQLIAGLTPGFLRSVSEERLSLAIDVYFRAKQNDICQIEFKRNEEWEKKGGPSLQLILALRDPPKYNFLWRLASLIFRNNLVMQRVSAAYIDPYSPESILILSVGLHGVKGGAAWEEADLDNVRKQLPLLEFFELEEAIQTTFVQPKVLRGHQAHLIRNMNAFVHQTLVHADPYLYSFENVREGLIRHPELTVRLVEIFEAKFCPSKANEKAFTDLRAQFLELLEKLDTGQASNDNRRKNILRQALNFIDHTLKTNYYLDEKNAFAFRLNPAYLDHLPYDRREKFPELPFAIFFFHGAHYMGFNIRFKDLARGGVRTVYPERRELWASERNTIFAESYNLAYTQQKKNKDIPEGGAKTAILLEPFEDVYAKELEIYKRELEDSATAESAIAEKLKIYRAEHRLAYLYASQRSFIESLLTLVNCEDDGRLKKAGILDYYKKPEYLYLGPDENSHNSWIDWVAQKSLQVGYRVGLSFMTSKPTGGINHKQYGVTSYGVNVYMHEMLCYLGIDPEKQPFTVKISGGPDGDVAGNQILNLYTYYKKTARLLALTDVSGTIFDPEGLDLEEMVRLFRSELPICNYATAKLHEGGFLLDLKSKREQSAYAQQTKLTRKKQGKLTEEWLSGNEMNLLFRHNVHQVKADIFIPGGGRPRTLNDANYRDYLDDAGKPTSRAIVEGANLYLTPNARLELEKLGVLIFKDSSCNKGGVISSSLEVLEGLLLSLDEFLKCKEQYVKEILEFIRKAALYEAKLLLTAHDATGEPLSTLSDKVSERINYFKYQLLDHLIAQTTLPEALLNCLLLYCPPLLRTQYKDRILKLPEIHKRAMIACFLASRLVYRRGLAWAPHIGDILSNLASDPTLIHD